MFTEAPAAFRSVGRASPFHELHLTNRRPASMSLSSQTTTLVGRLLAFMFPVVLVVAGTAGPAVAQHPEMVTVFEQLRENTQGNADRMAGSSTFRTRSLATATPKVLSSVSLSDLEIRESQDAFNEQGWPREDINFEPYASATRAGDVNGDGVNDWIYEYSGVADNRTSDLSRRTDKTLLVFGGGDFSETYYDELYYRDLTPAGTFVGNDANADAIQLLNGGEGGFRIYTGASEGYLEGASRTEPLPIRQAVTAPGDLDGDGHDDLVFYDLETHKITVVYGADTPDKVEVSTYDTSTAPKSGVPQRFTYTVGDVNEDGSAEIIRVQGYNDDVDQLYPVASEVFEVQGNRNVQSVQEMRLRRPDGGDPLLEPSFAQLTVAEVDGNGTPELILESGADTNTYVYSAESGVYNGEDPALFPSFVEHIGDLNGDGQADFAYRTKSDTAVIGYGPDALANGLSKDLSLANGVESIDFGLDSPLGDVTGDGRDDLIAQVTLTERFGPRLIQTTSEGTATETTDLLFEEANYGGEEIYMTENVGDWNGDGTDDVALVYGSPAGARVEIYYDDPSSNPPNLTFSQNTPFRYEPSVATGDFTGNGSPNLVVGWASENGTVDVFEAGDGATPIHSFDVTDLGIAADAENIGTGSAQTTVGNVGDVNDNGTDDLAVTVPAALTDAAKAAFLFTEPSLSSSPDVTIDYSGDNRVSDFMGSAIQALGDINNDGIDDFAIGDVQRTVSPQQGGASGGIFVHFGRDAAVPDFGTPDVTIEPKPDTGEQLLYFSFGIAAADVTGNGHPDLISKPYSFQNNNTGNGIDALYVYEGGDAFDATVDASAPLPGFLSPDTQAEYTNTNLGELTVLPPASDGGRPRIMVGTFSSGGNALVYEANDSGTNLLSPTMVFRGPDQNSGLGAGTNFIAGPQESTGVGDYNGDGQTSIILPQRSAGSFRGTPAYEYVFGESGTTEPEEPVAQESEEVDASEESSASVDFEETGTSVSFSEETSGSGEVSVSRFNSAPQGASGVSQSNVSEYRVEISASDDLEVGSGTEVRFDVDRLEGVNNPEEVVIVTRDIPGLGSFEELETTYNSNTNELVATVGGFSEFAFASSTEPLFSYPDQVTTNVSQSFGQAQGPGDYRLVALPGAVDRPLGETLTGEAGVDWTAYWDNGSARDYFVEYDESDTFHFRPGRGFWVTSTQDWAVEREIETVSLNANQAVTIPLNEGWTIVSNPLDRDVAWRSIVAEGDVGQPLWRFDASRGFVRADVMRSAESGVAYYVYNATGLDHLTIPYPATGDGKSDVEETSRISRLSLSAQSVETDDPASTVRVGIGGETRQSMVAPPSQFEATSLRIVPEGKSDRAERTQSLLSERRPLPGDGETFPLQLTSRVDGPVRLEVGSLEPVDGRQVVLIDPASETTYDLRRDETITLTPEGEVMDLTLAMGTQQYVDRQREKALPEELTLTSYPNPMSKQGTLVYTLPEAKKVTLQVFDVLGRQVATLVSGRRKAGKHTVRIESEGWASGVYFGRLKAGDQRITKKITVVR